MSSVQPDTSGLTRRWFIRTGAGGPLVPFALTALAGALALFMAAPALFGIQSLSVMLVTLAAYLAGVTVSGYGLRRSYPHASLGLCNVVTLLRLVIVTALLMALFAGTGPNWPFVTLATIALSLDGVDGWLARRAGLTSAFGARFDVEVDSAFALVLALHAWLAGSAGPLVLVLGLPRYVFVLAGLVLPWLNQPLPERFSRKAVCVFQLAALILLQVPVLPQQAAALMVTGVALALLWSFGRDIRWLWRARSQ